MLRPGRRASHDTRGEYIALYPNVLLGVQRDHAFAIVLEPVNCERTNEHVELYYAVDSAKTPALDALRTENARLWKTVFEEDIFVVEGMRKGRHGEFFDGGRFSPVMDGPTPRFSPLDCKPDRKGPRRVIGPWPAESRKDDPGLRTGSATDRDALDRQLLEAHARKDGPSLVRLYTLAADRHEAEGNIDAACFFLTHAFVYALEAGVPEAKAVNMRLAERGRAHVLTF